MKRELSMSVVWAVLLVAVLASCGGPPEAGFARLEFANNTDTKITLVEMDGDTIFNSSMGIAVGDTYDKVLEFAISGSYTFTAKNGTDTLSTATESIEVNTSNSQTISFGTDSSSGDSPSATVTFSNDTTKTIAIIALWTSAQDPNIDTQTYSLSPGDELPLMGLAPGDTATDDLPNADGSYQVGVDFGDGYVMQSDNVTLSPDTTTTYSIDEE